MLSHWSSGEPIRKCTNHIICDGIWGSVMSKAVSTSLINSHFLPLSAMVLANNTQCWIQRWKHSFFGCAGRSRSLQAKGNVTMKNQFSLGWFISNLHLWRIPFMVLCTLLLLRMTPIRKDGYLDELRIKATITVPPNIVLWSGEVCVCVWGGGSICHFSLFFCR